MNIEEFCNSDDIEIAQMYCNIYLQTHTIDELTKISRKYITIYDGNNNTIRLENVFSWDSNSVWLKDPTRAILINLK
jgi:hypothetical protein